MTNRSVRWTAVLVAGVLAAGGCAKKTGAGGDGPPRAPLTGKVARAELTRPVLAVKIENAPAARPQSGLDRADIVYEELVEGGITRFVALFHSRSASEVGPVRSARQVDPDILREYGKPLFAYSGAAGYVRQYIDQSGAVVPLRHGKVSEPFGRVGFRGAPHNLYTKTSALYQAAEGQDEVPKRPAFRFGSLQPPVPPPSPAEGETAEPAEHEPGDSVEIDFSTRQFEARWEYDSETRRYRRSQGGNPHRMRDDRRIAADNVLLMVVQTEESEFRDAAGNTTPNTVVTGAGKAYLLRNGVRFEGRWRRQSLDQATSFIDTGGRPFVLATGQTWVELVPSGVDFNFG